MAVFSFRVPPGAKNYPDGKHAFVIAFHGLVYADPSDGMVMRRETHVDGPPGYPYEESGWDIDYEPVTISGREMILPVKVVARYREGRFLSRNEIQSTNYRSMKPIPRSPSATTPPATIGDNNFLLTRARVLLHHASCYGSVAGHAQQTKPVKPSETTKQVPQQPGATTDGDPLEARPGNRRPDPRGSCAPSRLEGFHRPQCAPAPVVRRLRTTGEDRGEGVRL